MNSSDMSQKLPKSILFDVVLGLIAFSNLFASSE